LGCLLGALLLHGSLCEWRTFEYRADEAESVTSRVLVSFRKDFHVEGNAPSWDRRRRELSVYNAAWIECYFGVRGEPVRGSPFDVCLQRSDFGGGDPTTRAVALVRCELEIQGILADRELIDSCVRGRGFADSHLPRWTRDLIGKRFEGPYYSQTALLAEAPLSRPTLDRVIGLVLGLVLPAGLCLLALSIAARGSRRPSRR
jgi:hypothetical protein